MKSRVFIISILIISALRLSACGPFVPLDPNEHYFFYLGYETQNDSYRWKIDLDEQLKKENLNFWYNYVNKKVSKKEIENALFERNSVVLDDKFYKYLLDKKDVEVINYWL